jgi:hypothetical protein
MFARYYSNWARDDHGREPTAAGNKKPIGPAVGLALFDFIIILLSPLTWFLALLAEPLAGAVNPLVRALLPAVEWALRAGVKAEAGLDPLTRSIISSVKEAGPAKFDA